MTLPKLSPGMAQALFIAAKQFVTGTPLALRPGTGLVVCFENKAVAWVPDLTQPRAFPIGAMAVDVVAATIYVRTQGQGWRFNYSAEGGAA